MIRRFGGTYDLHSNSFLFQNADYRLGSMSYASEMYATPRLRRKFMRKIATSHRNDMSASSHRIISRDHERLEQRMASATETSVWYLPRTLQWWNNMHTWKLLQHRNQMFYEWALTWSPLQADYVRRRINIRRNLLITPHLHMVTYCKRRP
jgi:hypothetical protein